MALHDDLAAKLADPDEGGFSVSAQGKAPRSGVMVSRLGAEEVVPGVASARDVANYHRHHARELTPGRYLGGWVERGDDQHADALRAHAEGLTHSDDIRSYLQGRADEVGTKTYLDVSQRYPAGVQARNAIKANQQIAGWNVSASDEIAGDAQEPLIPLEPNVPPAWPVYRRREELTNGLSQRARSRAINRRNPKPEQLSFPI